MRQTPDDYFGTADQYAEQHRDPGRNLLCIGITNSSCHLDQFLQQGDANAEEEREGGGHELSKPRRGKQ